MLSTSRFTAAMRQPCMRMLKAHSLAPVRPKTLVPRRQFCAKPEPEPRSDLPMVAKVAAAGKTGVTSLFWLGVGVVVVASGYTIVTQLLPVGLSAQALFNKASDAVRGDPEAVAVFGDSIKTYGADFNTRREGRRFHIEEHKYEKNGTKFLRIRFNVEGSNGKRGIAFAELSDKSSDFVYLMIQVPSTGEVVRIHDNRQPEKPRSQRLSELGSRLYAARATFYSAGPTDAASRNQADELGEQMKYLKVVRCDRDEVACKDAGVEAAPAWKIYGRTYAGTKSLDEMEELMSKVG